MEPSSAPSRVPTVSGVAARYPLPAGSETVVSVGSQVARGDILARIPRQPMIVAVAAEINAPAAETVAAALPAVGAHVDEGAPLASLRRRLRTHVSRAPAAGMISTTHPLGAIALLPDDESVPVRARFGGLVTHREAQGVVVETPAICLPVSYALCPAGGDLSIVAVESLLAGPFTARTPLPPLTTDTALVLAHVGDQRALAQARQQTVAALILGTVSEAVAWELCTDEKGTSSEDGPTILILAGFGGADTGRRAVAPLREWHGAAARVDRDARMLALLAESDAARAQPAPLDEGAPISFHTPAYWGDAGTTNGHVHEHALESGLRVLAAQTASERRGTALTPVENFRQIPRTT